LIVLIHFPVDLGGFDQGGAGFFEGGAADALGEGGIKFLGGSEENIYKENDS
jgi:hypothetical protein